MKVSVIIPSFNRAKMLGITIESFINQNYPKDQYEIIIADNNSTDNTEEVVKYWQGKSPVSIKYISEKRQGVHYARNSAAKHSIGDILYYTDDDMIADKDLLENLMKVFAMGYNIGAATGRVLPKWEIAPPQWILKYCYDGKLSIYDPKEDFIISPFDIGVYSCNQAILRDVFFQSGGFNPENTAGEWIGDGETGLNIKIRELGYKFAYIGNAVIYHMIPPERMTQKYLNNRMANQGNADSYSEYQRHIYSSLKLYMKILTYINKLLGNFTLFCLRYITLLDYWRMNRAYVSYYYSRIKYDYRLIKDADWRELVLKNDWLNE